MVVVGYLALGTLYLLAPRAVARAWLAIMVILTIMAIVLLSGASVDPVRLRSETEPGWQAIDRSALIKAIMIAVNSIGTLIIVGGAVYSAFRGRYLLGQYHDCRWHLHSRRGRQPHGLGTRGIPFDRTGDRHHRDVHRISDDDGGGRLRSITWLQGKFIGYPESHLFPHYLLVFHYSA